jgi:catechol 2,3-dioxygenase-like lactoylglutathione lyase family enzyme
MEIPNYEIILYVANQQLSRVFYSNLLQLEPVLDLPGMTEFNLSQGLKLGLMPEDGIARILGNKMPDPSTGRGIPRCELYLLVENHIEMYEKALDAGAVEISKIQERDWGHSAGYVSDPDGHIIAFAKETGTAEQPLKNTNKIRTQ